MANDIVLLIEGLESASIRKTDDGLYSVHDAIALCGAKNPSQTLDRIDRAYPEDQSITKCERLNLARSNGRSYPTLVASKSHLLKIIGLLPGKMGKSYRSAAAELVVRYIEADTTLIGDIAERSTDSVGLNREMGRLRDRLKFIEGKDFSKMRDGKTSLTPVMIRIDDTDSSYAKVLHIAQHEMSDEELIRAGMFPSNVALRKDLGHPEMIDAIADYLGLIKNGWVDELYRMRRDRIAKNPADFLEEMEDVAFLRSRQHR